MSGSRPPHCPDRAENPCAGSDCRARRRVRRRRAPEPGNGGHAPRDAPCLSVRPGFPRARSPRSAHPLDCSSFQSLPKSIAHFPTADGSERPLLCGRRLPPEFLGAGRASGMELDIMAQGQQVLPCERPEPGRRTRNRHTSYGLSSCCRARQSGPVLDEAFRVTGARR